MKSIFSKFLYAFMLFILAIFATPSVNAENVVFNATVYGLDTETANLLRDSGKYVYTFKFFSPMFECPQSDLWIYIDGEGTPVKIHKNWGDAKWYFEETNGVKRIAAQINIELLADDVAAPRFLNHDWNIRSEAIRKFQEHHYGGEGSVGAVPIAAKLHVPEVDRDFDCTLLLGAGSVDSYFPPITEMENSRREIEIARQDTARGEAEEREIGRIQPQSERMEFAATEPKESEELRPEETTSEEPDYEEDGVKEAHKIVDKKKTRNISVRKKVAMRKATSSRKAKFAKRRRK